MNLQLIAIRSYFGVFSAIAPKRAAKKGFEIFQKVRKKNIRQREQEFFKAAAHTRLTTAVGPVDYYTLGDPNNPVIFLVHGWDSNAGSLAKIAEKMVELQLFVVLMNLPGHAFAQKSSTNLIECKKAFQELVNHIKPIEPFSVISHSFGSAVVAYALSDMNYQVDKLIFLTNPNKVEAIFETFKSTIGLGDKAYQELLSLTESILGEPIKDVSVQNKLKLVNFNDLVLIHDKLDRVLPYSHSLEIQEAFPTAKLYPFEKIGHYKMLWNDEVIKCCELHLN